MSLWDPEAAGNAACFLRLDDMKMLEIRNAPFEGGKQVWIPNSETGYMKANIISDGDKPGTTKVSFPHGHFRATRTVGGVLDIEVFIQILYFFENIFIGSSCRRQRENLFK